MIANIRIIKVVIMKMKIVYINVLMMLVSITPGHVKLDWLSPPKVDRVNESDSKYNEDDKDDNNKNEDE